MTIEINATALRFCAPAVSLDRIRYYLRGVSIKLHPQGVVYAATNGYIMSVYVDDAPDAALVDALKAYNGDFILKLMGKLPATALTLTCDRLPDGGESGQVTALALDERHRTTPLLVCNIGAVYPSYERAIGDLTEYNQPVNMALTSLDGWLLSKLVTGFAALKAKQKEAVPLSMFAKETGPKIAVLVTSETANAFAVIMSMRGAQIKPTSLLYASQSHDTVSQSA